MPKSVAMRVTAHWARSYAVKEVDGAKGKKCRREKAPRVISNEENGDKVSSAEC